MDEAIMNYLKRKYNLLIGERTAEQIKIELGSAYPLDKPLTMEIKGRNLIEGVPKTITIEDSEIREALGESISTIMNAIRVALERTPPELSADISDRGIVLTGGGALIKNLDKRIREETGLPVSIADDPLPASCWARARCSATSACCARSRSTNAGSRGEPHERRARIGRRAELMAWICERRGIGSGHGILLQPLQERPGIDRGAGRATTGSGGAGQAHRFRSPRRRRSKPDALPGGERGHFLRRGCCTTSAAGFAACGQATCNLIHVREDNAGLKAEIERLRLEQASLAEDAKQGQRLQRLLDC